MDLDKALDIAASAKTTYVQFEVRDSPAQHFTSPAQQLTSPDTEDAASVHSFHSSDGPGTSTLSGSSRPETRMESPFEECCNAYRKLRNECIEPSFTGPDLRRVIDDILPTCRTILTRENDNRKLIVLRRIIAQFLGNLASAKPSSRFPIWSNVLISATQCLQSSDIKLTNYTAFALHSCLLDSDVTLAVVKNKDLVELLIVMSEKNDPSAEATEDPGDFTLLCLRRCFSCLDFFVETFWTLRMNHRHAVLAFLCACHDELNRSIIEYLSQLFNSETTANLAAADDVSSERFRFYAKLVELVSHLSCNEFHRLVLNRQTETLKAACEVLLILHLRGKTGDPNHAPLQSTDDFRKDEAELTGSVRFKRDLVHIVANLVYDHSENKSLVRKSGVIPAILEASQLDARNPFIKEYATICISNLCKDCPDNQSYIRELTATRPVIDIGDDDDHDDDVQIVDEVRVKDKIQVLDLD